MFRPILASFLLTLLAFGAAPVAAQSTIPFNDQDLWLSGGNVAWVNFSGDIGPGNTNLAQFETIFQELHASGGNAMRLWLHTTGDVSPAYSATETGVITGPGEGTIEDLQAILDLAWENEIGLKLCLWSFDMLQTGRSATKLAQNRALLESADLTQTYIDNALVPMVDALEDHPAIIAWEIFNEPEGMTREFGWTPERVGMADIQRFVNQTVGAIHRAAPGVLVTNGSWSFRASSDRLSQAGQPDMNYYADARLVAAGGDPDGTLDFYSVHYYEWGGTALSPFHHPASYWSLNKPIVMAEFFMGGGSGDGNNDAVYGVPYEDLYETLYDTGYAGALAWQWFNYPVSAEGVINWPRILESTQTMFDLHPEDVDIDPGFRLLSFTASPEGIEAGQTSTLEWSTSNATVTLDGSPVDASGVLAVSPEATTTYTLVATDVDDATNTETASVTVSVLEPSEINRALNGPVTASTYETCCGVDRAPEGAVDGDPATRWASAWNDGASGGTADEQLDDDPNDEWIAVDLGQAYDIARVVLSWEAAYGASYDIEVSYDGHLWRSVYEERSGDGGTDEITFATPASGRFVRMHGLDRVTIGGQRYGFSLFEMEVYGLESALQPPEVAFANPGLQAIYVPGVNLTLTAEATDSDGTIASVQFVLDGEPLATDDAAPFTAAWSGAEAGEHVLTAIATDSDGLVVSTGDYPVLIAPAASFQRYEAEAAQASGDIATVSEPGASGGSYAEMNGESGGTLVWTVDAVRAGPATVTVGYRLPFGEKTQYLVVDGDSTSVRFTGPDNQWLQRRVTLDLEAGANTIRMERFWGYMHVDYLGVEMAAVVGTDDAPEASGAPRLGPAAPNPFSGVTTLTYRLAAPGAVRLDVLDVTGRRVATLADGPQAAGAHTVRFDASGLSNGVYLVRLQAGDAVQVRRVLLTR